MNCVFCDKPIIGGKGDWWHVSPTGEYGDIHCEGGGGLACPPRSRNVMNPPSRDDRRISWNGANWQFFYQGRPGMTFFAQKNALRWAGVNFGTNHDEDWYNARHRINPFRVDL